MITQKSMMKLDHEPVEGETITVLIDPKNPYRVYEGYREQRFTAIMLVTGIVFIGVSLLI